MKIIATALPEIKIIEPRVFEDDRGFFFESFQQQRYQEQEIGIDLPFVQDNISRSKYGVLRGLHYQLKFPQGKLVTVITGEVFDVVVDIRSSSPNFGKWVGVILSDKNHRQLYIPPGFAHGFCVLSDTADFYYKCTDYYRSDDESGVIWNDQDINIVWPQFSIQPILSPKDTNFNSLRNIAKSQLPV